MGDSIGDASADIASKSRCVPLGMDMASRTGSIAKSGFVLVGDGVEPPTEGELLCVVRSGSYGVGESLEVDDSKDAT